MDCSTITNAMCLALLLSLAATPGSCFQSSAAKTGPFSLPSPPVAPASSKLVASHPATLSPAHPGRQRNPTGGSSAAAAAAPAAESVALSASTAAIDYQEGVAENASGAGAGLFGRRQKQLLGWQSAIVRMGMVLFVAGMCVALPATLLPQRLLLKFGLITKTQKEMLALRTGQFCARWLLRLIPFCRVDVVTGGKKEADEPQPAIWVCNHTSMLDIFILLAADKRLRPGDQRRPIKVVYWLGLESNPITKLLFRQAGFIPVQMADNGHGNANEYDISSFKRLLKDCKNAFKEGFDVGLLPEGQLNPETEKGVLSVFPGAYNLAKMSRRPVRFMALHGADKLWHPTRGMECSSRRVKVRCYETESHFKSPGQFVQAFTHVVGQFGKSGEDLPDDELKSWLSGHLVNEGGGAPEKKAGGKSETSGSPSPE